MWNHNCFCSQVAFHLLNVIYLLMFYWLLSSYFSLLYFALIPGQFLLFYLLCVHTWASWIIYFQVSCGILDRSQQIPFKLLFLFSALEPRLLCSHVSSGFEINLHPVGPVFSSLIPSVAHQIGGQVARTVTLSTGTFSNVRLKLVQWGCFCVRPF